ncbi:MAG: DUF234 domain-containing protein [Anaerolineae bacterium]
MPTSSAWRWTGRSFAFNVKFVASTFEEVCCAWILKQVQKGELPFAPDNVSTHWSRDVQVDVVAIAWQEKQVLLGKCKWGDRPVSRAVVTELVERKTPKVLRGLPDRGEGWTVHYVLFGRFDFSNAARSKAAQVGARLLNLKQLQV